MYYKITLVKKLDISLISLLNYKKKESYLSLLTRSSII